MLSSLPSNIVRKGKRKTKTESILEEIENEYGLKMNHFNPNKPSPNVFLNKLQWRMHNYYDTMKSFRTTDRK
jgi:hypothetical protein